MDADQYMHIADELTAFSSAQPRMAAHPVIAVATGLDGLTDRSLVFAIQDCHEQLDSPAITWIDYPSGELLTRDEVDAALRFLARLLAIPAYDRGEYVYLHT